MASPPSSSDPPRDSSAFQRLHPRIQRWIWDREWPALRPIQERAIPPILDARSDVIISAPTAGGKTEAAFLPIASALATKQVEGLGCLCVSPLKALINDQHSRLERLFEYVDLPTHRWHGDVSSSKKRDLMKAPRGLVLITPESLESMFVSRGTTMPTLWRTVEYVVVDELHAFIGTERGRQLQSLLHRVEGAAGRRIPRIGLSATLGDMALGARFLCHHDHESVLTIVDADDSKEVGLQLRGYIRTAPRPVPEPEDSAASDEPAVTEAAPDPEEDGSIRTIAEHLFRTLRGSNNLVFANSRARVEELADILRRRCERERVPNEFLPHHGSLAKELREDVEALLKDESRAANVVCTSTLELGIDIGDVKSIAQVGVPPSVASLRQRLGRSGRRDGETATMRAYIVEPELTPDTPTQDTLRPQLVQTVAMIDLFVVDNWCEPSDPGQLHLSTLIQQTLSLIAQHGGVGASRAYDLLCRSGPFIGLTPSDFADLLRQLGRYDLVMQTGSGELVLGVAGEQLVDHYTFFTAFSAPEEYRIAAGDRVLGSLPIVFAVYVGMHIIFAGRRWRVTDVDPMSKLLVVESSPGGRPPTFEGSGISVHSRVRAKMQDTYASTDVPRYLDAIGRRLLEEGRDAFRRLGLGEHSLIAKGKDVFFFPWTGDRAMTTIALWLKTLGIEAELEGVSLTLLDCTLERTAALVTRQAQAAGLDVLALAQIAPDLIREKHDRFAPVELLRRQFAIRELDPEGAQQAIRAAAR
jgi:ATP-dependent Lhr-like helicase